MDALALALTAAAMIMFAFAASGRELRRFNEIALGLVFLSAALIGQFTSVTARTSAADRTRYTLGGRRREVRGAGVREAAEPAAGADDPGEPAAVRILRTAYPAGRERDRAVRWLVWIAAHQGDRRNLAWWDIAAWVGEPGLRFARTLTGAGLLGLAFGLGFGAYLGSRGLAAGPLAAIAAAYIGSKLRPGKLRRSRPPRAMVPRWPRSGRDAAVLALAVLTGLFLRPALIILWARPVADSPAASPGRSYRACRRSTAIDGAACLLTGLPVSLAGLALGQLALEPLAAALAGFAVLTALADGRLPELKQAELALLLRRGRLVSFRRLLRSAADCRRGGREARRPALAARPAVVRHVGPNRGGPGGRGRPGDDLPLAVRARGRLAFRTRRRLRQPRRHRHQPGARRRGAGSHLPSARAAGLEPALVAVANRPDVALGPRRGGGRRRGRADLAGRPRRGTARDRGDRDRGHARGDRGHGRGVGVCAGAPPLPRRTAPPAPVRRRRAARGGGRRGHAAAPGPEPARRPSRRRLAVPGRSVAERRRLARHERRGSRRGARRRGHRCLADARQHPRPAAGVAGQPAAHAGRGSAGTARRAQPGRRGRRPAVVAVDGAVPAAGRGEPGVRRLAGPAAPGDRLVRAAAGRSVGHGDRPGDLRRAYRPARRRADRPSRADRSGTSAARAAGRPVHRDAHRQPAGPRGTDRLQGDHGRVQPGRPAGPGAAGGPGPPDRPHQPAAGRPARGDERRARSRPAARRTAGGRTRTPPAGHHASRGHHHPAGRVRCAGRRPGPGEPAPGRA